MNVDEVIREAALWDCVLKADKFFDWAVIPPQFTALRDEYLKARADLKLIVAPRKERG